jgi:hypothetical protein
MPMFTKVNQTITVNWLMDTLIWKYILACSHRPYILSAQKYATI